MQGATVDFPQHNSGISPAEAGHCGLRFRESVTQALLQALQKDCNDSRNRFVPRGALINIITMECAERVLQASLRRPVEDMTWLQKMARDISPSPEACFCRFKHCTGGRMILATLFLCGKEDLILSFFLPSKPQICDSSLPFRFNSPDVFDYGLTTEDREILTSFQWYVYTPFLTGITSGRKEDIVMFPEEASLPWMSKERLEEPALGEVSYVERIEIHPCNHALVSLIPDLITQ